MLPCPFCGSKPLPLVVDYIAGEIFDKPAHKKYNRLEAHIGCSNADCASSISFRYEMGMLLGMRQDEIIKTFKEQTAERVIRMWNRRTVLE